MKVENFESCADAIVPSVFVRGGRTRLIAGETERVKRMLSYRLSPVRGLGEQIHSLYETLKRGSFPTLEGMPAPLHFSIFESFLIRASLAVLREVFDAVDILSLIKLSKTSKALRRVFLCYAQATWDPARRYRRWFGNVGEFRRLLRKSNAVISGSFALQFFDRSFYADSDMDIFTRIAGVSTLCDFLISEGYQCVGHSDTAGQQQRGLFDAVCRFAIF